jgi:formyltetrahydrofolate-dependent phosphoribosylglycinamide formyltransferase
MRESVMKSSEAITAEQAAEWRDSLDALGKRLVFTSGCFDILHAGHVRYLAQARALGDALVVGMNGDESVRALKGPGRPVHEEADRAEVLLGLAAVDAVVIFHSARTTELIRMIRPHVFAKGGDYTVATLNPEERGALEAYGAEIRILPVVAGRSTSATLAKLSEPAGALRFAVLGSGSGSLLEPIADEIGRLGAEVALVVSDQPGAGILGRAGQRGIPSLHVDPGPQDGEFTEAALKELADRLRAAGVQWVLCAGFGRRLGGAVTEAFAGRILNIHPSLLPAFPSKQAIAEALAAGAAETGCTVHEVTADGPGRILGQERIVISPDETEASLRARINAAERILFPAVLASLFGSGH